MLRVGLTGGIACGKSRVLRRLESRGCRTLDLDRVAHEVMAPGGSAYPGVVAAFGPRILAADGAIDRKALGALVFEDPAARERLNGIVHPRIRIEERRLLAALAGAADTTVVVDAALLVEGGLHLRFDRLVVVHCSAEEQLHRLMARDSLSREDAEARVRAQMPVVEKRRFSHFEVDSSGQPEHTDAAADVLAEALRSVARAPAAAAFPEPDRLAGLLSVDEWAGERGLAIRLLEGIASDGGLEMPRLAALIGRRPGASWLAGPGEPAAVRPAAIVAPVVAWCLARRGVDDDLLGLAALSLARSVTLEAGLIAEACATAWSAARFAAGEEVGGAESEVLAAAFARRWSGAAARRAVAAFFSVPRQPAVDVVDAVGRFLAAARSWSPS